MFRGQCYNGTKNMCGIKKGVSTHTFYGKIQKHFSQIPLDML